MKSLNLAKPLVLAPLAGGPSCPALVAAVSNAGGLGSAGLAYSSPAQIEGFAVDIRRLTSKPFAFNLFAPALIRSVSAEEVARAVEATTGFRAELGLPTPAVVPPFEEDFSAQFEAVLRAKPAVFSFVFGRVPDEAIREAQRAGILVVGTATSREEALALEDCDAVVLQGIEAGGHRALFSSTASDPEITLAELLATVRISIPVIAAGGLMNGEDIRNVMKAGAWAAQMGTAFLCCKEAGTSDAYREKLRGRRLTRTTRVYSGRLARGIENRFMNEMPIDAVMPFPQQNRFTRDLRSRGGGDFMSLWSGTGKGELWQGSAVDFVDSLFAR